MAELQSQLESQAAATRQAEANAKEAEAKAASQATLAAAARAEVGSSGPAQGVKVVQRATAAACAVIAVARLVNECLRFGACAGCHILPLSICNPCALRPLAAALYV
jgi:hypothetical protein